jgi:hypothetical protein
VDVEMPVEGPAVGVEAVIVAAELLAAHDPPRDAAEVAAEPGLERERPGLRRACAVARAVIGVVVDRKIREAVGGIAADRRERLAVRARMERGEEGEEGKRDRADGGKSTHRDLDRRASADS